MIRRCLAVICVLALALLVFGGWAEAQVKSKAANPCAANPCAVANPCAAKGASKAAPAANPCAAQNPCAAKNPCAGKGAWVPAVAKMAKAAVIGVQPNSLQLRTATGPLTVSLDRRTQVRQGPAQKRVADLKAGDEVTVSYVEKQGARRAAYIYIAQKGGANPCAAKGASKAAPAANPCAAQNPCAAKNPCGAKK